jgi:hypothetical protein
LQAAIAHHGIVPNNLDPVPTIDAPAFADLVGEFFQAFKLEFLVKSSEKNSLTHHLFSAEG